MNFPPFAGAGHLTTLIADVVSRPYRAFAGRVIPPARVIDAVPVARLRGEIDAIGLTQCLVRSGTLQVYWARAAQIPGILQEIGRLRELTFRAVGEGSGKGADIDPFDSYYLHLFLWDTATGSIVGAYRLGLVDSILESHGKRGLYTHSLFKYRGRMLDALNPAIELGRSFVRAEYQRNFAPLVLLWRGIARFVERHPQYAVLFGPVSISNTYSPASRELIVRYLSAETAGFDLATQVTPRHPFRNRRWSVAIRRNTRQEPPRSIRELSRLVQDIEPDHKGIPVLLRQYLELGGRILAFNLDRDFGDVLDGLIMVDVRQIEPAVLARYMGESGALSFRAYHGLASHSSPAAARDAMFGSRREDPIPTPPFVA